MGHRKVHGRAYGTKHTPRALSRDIDKISRPKWRCCGSNSHIIAQGTREHLPAFPVILLAQNRSTKNFFFFNEKHIRLLGQIVLHLSPFAPYPLVIPRILRAEVLKRRSLALKIRRHTLMDTPQLSDFSKLLVIHQSALGGFPGFGSDLRHASDALDHI